MINPLILKLEHFARLSQDDKRELDRVCAMRVRRFEARQVIIHEGDRPAHVCVVLAGWACRYKVLEDGRKQVIGYFVPGDFCDLKVYILKQADHSVAAVTALALAEVPVDVIEELIGRNSRLTRALWWASLVAEAVEREWIVNLGQRSSIERIAHLFCELFHRLRCVGLVDGTSFNLPLTQAELAETTGMSPVHVNRSVKDLRAQNLIKVQGRTLTILDLPKLEQLAFFNPNYLHLERDGAELDANEI